MNASRNRFPNEIWYLSSIDFRSPKWRLAFPVEGYLIPCSGAKNTKFCAEPNCIILCCDCSKISHYYAVRLCTKFGVLGTGAGDKPRKPSNHLLWTISWLPSQWYSRYLGSSAEWINRGGQV